MTPPRPIKVLIETDPLSPSVGKTQRVYINGQELPVLSYQIGANGLSLTTVTLTLHADVEMRPATHFKGPVPERPTNTTPDPETFRRLHTGQFTPPPWRETPFAKPTLRHDDESATGTYRPGTGVHRLDADAVLQDMPGGYLPHLSDTGPASEEPEDG